MYEENEKKINWLSVLKRAIIFVVVLIVIFTIISLLTRCTNKNNSINPTQENINLSSEIEEMQDATIKYLTEDILPREINDRKTIKLKYLINNKIIDSLKDKQGNVCDVDASYSEVTRLENNYALKTVVNCGKNTDYKVIYIGCFDNCNGGICKGSESNSGLCSITETDSNSNTTTTTKKSTSSTTTTKKTSNTKVSKTSNTNNSTNSNKVQYQYKKAYVKLICEYGTLVNNVCRLQDYYTLTDEPVKNTNTTYKKSTVNANKEKVYLNNVAKNTSTATYEYITTESVAGKRKYVYNKYTCKRGTLNGKTCTISTPSTTTSYTCKDASFVYDSKNNKCYKQVVDESYTNPIKKTYFEYTWDYTSPGEGWVKTGKTN